MAVAGTALVVEGVLAVRSSLILELQAQSRVVHAVASVAEAARVLPSTAPDLLVLNVALPDGTAFDVLRCAAALPSMPRVVAVSGRAEPEAICRLLELGVRAFVSAPLRENSLREAVERALSRPPDLAQILRATVGLRPIFEVEEEVRRTMVGEALRRAEGSKRKAARLLSVSRQVLQHMLRRAAAVTAK